MVRRLADAVASKRVNANRLFLTILGRPPGRGEAAQIVALRFGAQIRNLVARRSFQDEVLPAIQSGDFSFYERIGPAPDQALTVWAAERLLPEVDQLSLKNADDWAHYALALFGPGDSLLHQALPPSAQSALSRQWAQWREKNPAAFRPLVAQRPTPGRIASFFELFLGRPPYARDDMNERVEAGYRRSLMAMLRSAEFQRVFLDWAAGETADYDLRLKKRAPAIAREVWPIMRWGDDEPSQPTSWRDLFASVWLNQERRDDLLSLLDRHQPTDLFIRDLIADSTSRFESDRPVSVLAAVKRPSVLEVYFKSRSGCDAEAVTIEAADSAGRILLREPAPALQSGRQRLRIKTNALGRASITPGYVVRVEGPDLSDAVPLRARPAPVPPEDVIDKINWLWARGRWDRALNQIVELREGGNIFAADFLFETQRRLLSPIEDAQFDWPMDDLSSLRGRREGEGAADFDDLTLEWMREHPGCAAYLAWIRGENAANGSAPVLRAIASADRDALQAASETLSSLENIWDALVAAQLANATGEQLAIIADRLRHERAQAVRKGFASPRGRLAFAAVLRASAFLPAELAGEWDMVLGAAKYAEAIGETRAACRIAMTAAKVRAPKPDILTLAATFAQRYGDRAEAVALYRRALDARPGDLRLEERYLRTARGLNLVDPLQRTPDFVARARAYREACVSALIDRPDAIDRRIRLAEALELEDNAAGALDVLRAAEARGTLPVPAKKRMVDLCVKTNENEEALRVAATIEPSEDSEWLAINEARALRALGRAEEAGELLTRRAKPGWRNVKREGVRNLFFIGDFEAAAIKGAALCATYVDDIELQTICAAANLELGRLSAGTAHVKAARAAGGADRFAEELDLFDYAIAQKSGDRNAIEKLNPTFHRLGCSGLRVRMDGEGRLDDFVVSEEGPPPHDLPPLTSGPLVSVVMTSYNSAAYIDAAIKSILDQRYRDLELIVVDDCSSDDTPERLRQWKARDARVRIILKQTNDGTYVSKNIGLMQALGRYVALQDSDDWSHPDRIGKSVAALEARSDLIGVTTDWLRMTSDGALMVKAGGQISHVCCISLVFRRTPVLDEIGFFDSVRIEADMEFIRRIRLRFGEAAYARLRWPLLFGRVRSDSLTGNEDYGISRTGFSEPRLQYQAAQAEWHAAIRSGAASPYMAYPLQRRAFPAPAIILPDRSMVEA